jgi:hypothetical protein
MIESAKEKALIQGRFAVISLAELFVFSGDGHVVQQRHAFPPQCRQFEPEGKEDLALFEHITHIKRDDAARPDHAVHLIQHLSHGRSPASIVAPGFSDAGRIIGIGEVIGVGRVQKCKIAAGLGQWQVPSVGLFDVGALGAGRNVKPNPLSIQVLADVQGGP